MFLIEVESLELISMSLNIVMNEGFAAYSPSRWIAGALDLIYNI